MARKMKKSNYILLISAWALGCLSVNAQNKTTNPKATSATDTLRRELTVVTDQNIQLGQLQGLSLNPVISKPVVPPFKASYLYLPDVYKPTSRLSPRNAISPMAGLFNKKNQRGYINVGAGLMYNAKADLGVKILADESNTLDFLLSHRSSWSDMSTALKDIKSKAKDSRFIIDLNYNHVFPSFELGLNGSYQNHYYNLYGIDNMIDINNIGVNSDRDIKDDITAHLFRLDAKVESSSLNNIDWIYEGDARLNFITKNMSLYNNSHKVTELNPIAHLSVFKALGTDSRFGIFGSYEGKFINSDDPLFYTYEKEKIEDFAKADKKEIPDTPKTSNLSTLSAGPYISFKGSNGTTLWDMKLGAGASIVFGINSGVFFWPKVDAGLQFSDNWSIRALLWGGTGANTMITMDKMMPFIAKDYALRPSKTKLAGRLSLSGLIASQVKLTLYGEYEKKDMDINFRPIILNGSSPEEARLTFRPYYQNTQRITGGADLKYQYSSLWGLSVGAKYNHYDKTDLVLSGRPELEFSAKAFINPIQGLLIEAAFDHTSGEKYYTPQYTEYKLGAKNRLSVHANYAINDKFSVYLNGAYHLKNYNERFYGYALQSYWGMLGVNFNF